MLMIDDDRFAVEMLKEKLSIGYFGHNGVIEVGERARARGCVCVCVCVSLIDNDVI